MTSETHIAVGARVRFHPDWYDAEHAAADELTADDVSFLNSLVGTVVGVDESARCSYYYVAWDGLQDGRDNGKIVLLGALSVWIDNQGRVTSCEQSDALIAA